ncbi:MAG TPA: dTDP-4-dehydrorhamnose reductase [Candidatus Hydrogenedentes bacterium]|nr:dTDP-4-dehydrorhamnose reductase [Candidatus Hydrogenedentota bacterium]
MRIMIIGSSGQLGSELLHRFSDAEVIPVDRTEAAVTLDIRDSARTAEVLDSEKPDMVINTAAFHNLLACEQQPAEAFAVNATATGNLAKLCAKRGIRLVHFSTNYVFGGTVFHDTTRDAAPDGPVPPRPYREDDPPSPINVLGASKLAGEYLIQAYHPEVQIIRTAALYGVAACQSRGGDRNFVENILHLAKTKRPMRLIQDIVTTPTHAADLAVQVRKIVDLGGPGVYHATCEGWCTWYEFGCAVLEECGISPASRPEAVSARQFQTPVRRPGYSVLENSRVKSLGIADMPSWRESLRRYLRLAGHLVG